MIFVMIFSLTMISLCIIMINKINIDVDACGGSQMKQSIIILLVLNCIILIGTVISGGYLYKDYIFA